MEESTVKNKKVSDDTTNSWEPLGLTKAEFDRVVDPMICEYVNGKLPGSNHVMLDVLQVGLDIATTDAERNAAWFIFGRMCEHNRRCSVTLHEALEEILRVG